jgi:ribonuclease VapC
MIVDASAIVAIALDEVDGRRLMERLQSTAVRLTTPVALYEAVLGIRRRRGTSVTDTQQQLQALLGAAEINLVPITSDAHLLALEAFDRFGKGTGHPAQLNMGDCFAYAVAKQRGVPLLYKGNDFSQTDLA